MSRLNLTPRQRRRLRRRLTQAQDVRLYRRILAVLIPRLVALQERGDSAAALSLIAEIKRAIQGKEGALH